MKKVKMILSIAAIMFAVGGALTTSAFENAPLTKRIVSDPADASCPQTGFCDDAISGNCYVSGTSGPIYKLRVTGPVSCSVNATGTFSLN